MVGESLGIGRFGWMRLEEVVVNRTESSVVEWVGAQVVEACFGRVVAGYTAVDWRALRDGLEEEQQRVVVVLGTVGAACGRIGFALPVLIICQHEGAEWSFGQGSMQ